MTTPHFVRPDHHELPRGTRLDGAGHDGSSLNRRPKQSTAPAGLWAPAPEVVAEKVAQPKRQQKTRISQGRPSRAKPASERIPVKVAEHGTDSGYKRHKRNGEDACLSCKRAHNERVRAYDKDRVRPQYLRPECGSEAGYRGHRARKERICDDCRLAHNGKQQDRRRTRAEMEGRELIPRQSIAQHGTASGYKRHKRIGEESCEACRNAKREYDREYKAERKRGRAA